MLICGVMTGTSVDAIDVALVRLHSEREDTLELRLHEFCSRPFEPELRRDILRLLEPSPVPMQLVSSVDARLGHAYAHAVARACAQTGQSCDLAVLHGQTVRHDVDHGAVSATLQLGQPAWLAARLGIPVLSDVRSRDVAEGGQGAPLAGTLDTMLLADRGHPVAAVNLGGIANLTIVGTRAPAAFDSGPANALIDAAVRLTQANPLGYDRDGALAAGGRVLPELLTALLAEPYYARPAPKSTGKELFNAHYLHTRLAAHEASHGAADPRDVVATVTELTARTVAAACAAHRVSEVIVSGGGSRNPELIRRLHAAVRREQDAAIPVRTSDDALGLPEAAKEACLMAVIGWLSWHGLPATLPALTGARRAAVAGRLSPGAGPLRLPPPRAVAPSRIRVLPTDLANGTTGTRR